MDWFYNLPKPVKILAPMVGNSDFPYRLLALNHGADATCTEMINTNHFLHTKATNSSIESTESHLKDTNLIIQLCGNDPNTMLYAANKLYTPETVLFDVNLGCPQEIARKGHYGSFLMDKPELIKEIVSTLSNNLSIPVSCKIRIFIDVNQTIEYAKMLEMAGCSMITIHGRTREQRGINTGNASWLQIKQVKQNLSIPVIANGNISEYSDIDKLIEYTKCDGVMIAESHLYNPYIFERNSGDTKEILEEYLKYVEIIGIEKCFGCVRSHFFKILHYDESLRDEIVTARNIDDFKLIVSKVKGNTKVRIRNEWIDPISFME